MGNWTLEEKRKYASELKDGPTDWQFKQLMKEHGITGWSQNEVILGWIPDYHFPKEKLIVELDGSVHRLQEVKRKDWEKRKSFMEAGYKLLSLTNSQVMFKPKEAMKLLKKYLSRNKKPVPYRHHKSGMEVSKWKYAGKPWVKPTPASDHVKSEFDTSMTHGNEPVEQKRKIKILRVIKTR
jgi:very-short-patch-repair endonuclease